MTKLNELFNNLYKTTDPQIHAYIPLDTIRRGRITSS